MLKFFLETRITVENITSASTVVHGQPPTDHSIKHLQCFIELAWLILFEVVEDVGVFVLEILLQLSIQILSGIMDNFIDAEDRRSVLSL